MTSSKPPDEQWWKNAACLGAYALFDDIGQAAKHSSKYQEAAKVCATCSVNLECLEEAMSLEDETDALSDAGFRAGTTKRYRKAQLKKIRAERQSS